MRFKEGVTIFGVKPEIVAILPIINEVYIEIAGQGCTITSLIDGVHSIRSMHKYGFAVDVRTRDDAGYNLTQWRPGIKDEIVKQLKLRLTHEYDVVLEKDHIHCEFDIRKVI
jgi:hypothetical protein